jgi:O-antigen/teichoic acid export membrane protein
LVLGLADWRTPSLKRNVLMNWISIVAAMAFALVIQPMVVRRLGNELYGVWSFLNGLALYSTLLYLGPRHGVREEHR